MSRSIDSVFDKAVNQLDREERRLIAMTKSGDAPVFDHEGFSAINRALSYVVMGGVLEELMRDLPQALATDVAALGIERRKLPVSLLAALDAAEFRKCGNDNITSLIARANLVQVVVAHQVDLRPVLDFGELFKLADGHTINEKHFQGLWLVLGLPGDWRNHPSDSMLLKEIREKRNGVAHWTEDPVAVGRSKTASDLRGMTKQLVALLQHFQLCIWYWLDERIV